MIPDFFDALNKRYDRETLAVDFPKMLYDVQCESAVGDCNWEFFTSNQLQRTKIFYENNRVKEASPHKRAVIICNDYVKSKWSDLKGDARHAKLKELYIPIRMANANKTKEEAEKDFEAMAVGGD